MGSSRWLKILVMAFLSWIAEMILQLPEHNGHLKTSMLKVLFKSLAQLILL